MAEEWDADRKNLGDKASVKSCEWTPDQCKEESKENSKRKFETFKKILKRKFDKNRTDKPYNKV